MDNINFKVGEHVKVIKNPQTGKLMMCVEINDFNMFTTQNGNTYVSLTAIDSKDDKYGSSGFVKVSGKYDKETKTTSGVDAIVANIYPVEVKAVAPQVETATAEEAKDLPF